jgi:hypothetical protein
MDTSANPMKPSPIGCCQASSAWARPGQAVVPAAAKFDAMKTHQNLTAFTAQDLSAFQPGSVSAVERPIRGAPNTGVEPAGLRHVQYSRKHLVGFSPLFAVHVGQAS